MDSKSVKSSGPSEYAAKIILQSIRRRSRKAAHRGRGFIPRFLIHTLQDSFCVGFPLGDHTAICLPSAITETSILCGGIIGSVNRVEGITHRFAKMDIVRPAVLTTAVVLRLVKTPAGIGGWNKPGFRAPGGAPAPPGPGCSFYCGRAENRGRPALPRLAIRRPLWYGVFKHPPISAGLRSRSSAG